MRPAATRFMPAGPPWGTRRTCRSASTAAAATEPVDWGARGLRWRGCKTPERTAARAPCAGPNACHAAKHSRRSCPAQAPRACGTSPAIELHSATLPPPCRARHPPATAAPRTPQQRRSPPSRGSATRPSGAHLVLPALIHNLGGGAHLGGPRGVRRGGAAVVVVVIVVAGGAGRAAGGQLCRRGVGAAGRRRLRRQQLVQAAGAQAVERSHVQAGRRAHGARGEHLDRRHGRRAGGGSGSGEEVPAHARGRAVHCEPLLGHGDVRCWPARNAAQPGPLRGFRLLKPPVSAEMEVPQQLGSSCMPCAMCCQVPCCALPELAAFAAARDAADTNPRCTQ